MTNVTQFIAQLDASARAEVARRLRDAGLSADDIERALDSRLCDLADTIDITNL